MSDTEKEVLANEFAIAFLMPEREFRVILEKHRNGDVVDTAAIAEYFHVSVSNAAARGVSLGLLRQF